MYQVLLVMSILARIEMDISGSVPRTEVQSEKKLVVVVAVKLGAWW